MLLLIVLNLILDVDAKVISHAHVLNKAKFFVVPMQPLRDTDYKWYSGDPEGSSADSESASWH
jgi:hypothetical protein